MCVQLHTSKLFVGLLGYSITFKVREQWEMVSGLKPLQPTGTWRSHDSAWVTIKMRMTEPHDLPMIKVYALAGRFLRTAFTHNLHHVCTDGYIFTTYNCTHHVL